MASPASRRSGASGTDSWSGPLERKLEARLGNRGCASMEGEVPMLSKTCCLVIELHRLAGVGRSDEDHGVRTGRGGRR